MHRLARICHFLGFITLAYAIYECHTTMTFDHNPHRVFLTMDSPNELITSLLYLGVTLNIAGVLLVLMKWIVGGEDKSPTSGRRGNPPSGSPVYSSWNDPPPSLRGYIDACSEV